LTVENQKTDGCSNKFYIRALPCNRDIEMATICYVASFELRDAYLKKHPEILPEMDVM